MNHRQLYWKFERLREAAAQLRDLYAKDSLRFIDYIRLDERVRVYTQLRDEQNW